MEFHISRKARDHYRFDDVIAAFDGRVIFANFHAARVFAQRMNETRDLVRYPERAIQASHLYTMGLMDEIFHEILNLYREQKNPTVVADALNWLDHQLGRKNIDRTLRVFLNTFPPIPVYREEMDPEVYFNSEIEGTPCREILMEEMLMLWLAHNNPAMSPFQELFDDQRLDKETEYHKMNTQLHAFFQSQPPFGPDQQNFIDMLRDPAIAVPNSLPGQLEYIMKKWGGLLGSLLYRLLKTLDFIQEEEKPRFHGPGPPTSFDIHGKWDEPERFSEDLDWMPRVVLIAKNVYVWLDQLSKQYGKHLYRLDQIPDDELEILTRRGFTAVWLIGLWERSQASKRIKQLCGNPDAEASAYSLYDYQIAQDLGGWEAFENLKQRASIKGIQMAGDMVPNHTGIDGKWVGQHPDWFLSLNHSPYPSYRFSGPNLSSDDRMGIYIEDHYFDRSDAAVVFKRIDLLTEDEIYIYHGNDGTSMPWNDTAQLNFLNQEVREAVIRSILNVARHFPIIRLDAAMTLVKKHIQRLWFPEPGSGGAIPSRAEHGLSKGEFDGELPKEFWREVVDRVAQEAPGTLLLAEAFWMLEGYFVRTLGMHRVYNSAFMNMLKMELNADYRNVIKKTLQFNPKILKRFVNFMSNPDEDTAIAQFGRNDKYFGVVTMMATMPGLPMFGHGQVEGLTEKYGMEYRRAYWEETPDQSLIHRHEREIFPLLKKRHLFAHVNNFLLYNFYSQDGCVDENVFAYSNRSGNEKALVIYHNCFAQTQGWIHTSVSFAVKSEIHRESTLVQHKIGEGLALHNDDRYYTIFIDFVTGLEYIHSNSALWEQGLFVDLPAFKTHVFLDFREVMDDEKHPYSQLAEMLDGRGVPDIEEAMTTLLLRPIRDPFRKVLLALLEKNTGRSVQSQKDAFKRELLPLMSHCFKAIKTFNDGHGNIDDILKEIRVKNDVFISILNLDKEKPLLKHKAIQALVERVGKFLNSEPVRRDCLIIYLFLHVLGRIQGDEEHEIRTLSWMEEWMLDRIIAKEFENKGTSEEEAWRLLTILKILIRHQEWYNQKELNEVHTCRVIESLLRDQHIRRFLGINRYHDVLWFHKEPFEELVEWLCSIALLNTIGSSQEKGVDVSDSLMSLLQWIQTVEKGLDTSECQVDKLMNVLTT